MDAMHRAFSNVFLGLGIEVIQDLANSPFIIILYIEVLWAVMVLIM